MPNKTNLKRPRGPIDLSVSYVLPAAINYSHLQDVKSCDSTKETVRNKLIISFIFLVIYFIYLFSFSNNQQPSQPPVVY